LKNKSVSNRSTIVVLLALVMLFVSACVPARIGTSWGALQTITLNEQPRVMITYNNWVVILDPSTGRPAPLLNESGEVRVDDQGNARPWQIDGHSVNNAQFYARPLIQQGETETELLFPTFTDRLLTVDLSTARVQDANGITIGAVTADPVQDETTYYIPMFHQDLVAYDKSELTEKWRFTTAKGVWATPILDNGILYIVTADHFMYAVNAETGAAVWANPTDLEGLVGAAPLLHEGHLYVGSVANKLYKVDVTNGEIVDEITFTPNHWVWNTPTLYDGMLYVSDMGGMVHAINPDTLETIWSVQAAQRGIRPAPLVTEQYVIVASRDGFVHWLNRGDGTTAFSRQVEGAPEILSDLLLVEADEAAGINQSLVLVSTLNLSHLVVAYTLDEGTQKWVYAR
jgi:outer membrane protein assembly factor BamB